MLTVDGAHKKAMRGAPDVLKCRTINMDTAQICSRHVGLITPVKDDFLHPARHTLGGKQFVDKPRSSRRLGAHIEGQLQWVLRHADGEDQYDEVIRCSVVLSTDGASPMVGKRAGLGAVMKQMGAIRLLQFTDVGYEIESSYKSGKSGNFFMPSLWLIWVTSPAL